jgi:hypothetical protein
MYQDIFNQLEQITLTKVISTGRNNRYNFPEHRRATFGYVRERFSGKYNISLYSRKHKLIYEKLFELGLQICNHSFTSIHVIKNLICPPHKDPNNVGNSTIVSFGNYTGCKLIIEDIEQDAYETPIEFNGHEKQHWNTDDLQGTKYSVIFYNIKLPAEYYPYKIVIPSYRREKICNEQTLTTLNKMGIDKNMIYVFVTKDEYELYKNTLNPDYYGHLIIGLNGLVNQREFINTYFSEGSHLLSLDDDIKLIDLQYTKYKSLNQFILDAFNICVKNNCYIWSVNPVYNPYWRKAKLEMKKTKLNFCIGAFYGYINRYDSLLQLKICVSGNKEDVERSILYYLKDGITLRFNRVGFVTKYFANDGGGLGTFKNRVEEHKLKSIKINEIYPDITKIKIRKNGLYEIVF